MHENNSARLSRGRVCMFHVRFCGRGHQQRLHGGVRQNLPPRAPSCWNNPGLRYGVGTIPVSRIDRFSAGQHVDCKKLFLLMTPCTSHKHLRKLSSRSLPHRDRHPRRDLHTDSENHRTYPNPIASNSSSVPMAPYLQSVLQATF